MKSLINIFIMYRVIFFLFLFTSLNLFGQTDDPRNFVPTINGPAGNYLYVVNLDDLESNSALIESTDYFIIQRVAKSSEAQEISEKDIKEIGRLQKVKTYAELNEFFSTEDLAELRTQYGEASAQELLNRFINFKSPDEMPFLYPFVETRQALGHLFLDKDVQDGMYYNYNVIRVDKTGERTDWGNGYAKGGMGNYTLPYLKPSWTSAEGRDSMMKINWNLVIDEEKINEIPMGKVAEEENYNQLLHQLPFSYAALRAKVMVDRGNGYEEKGIIFPTYSALDDTLFYEYYEYKIGEDYMKSYLVLMDEVYNLGQPSDTALVFTDDSTSATIINEIVVTDTLNGIIIDWEALPKKNYYAGIEILRYDSDDQLDTVAMLSPNENQYWDREIEVGQYYRYQVKALFVPQVGLEQRVPAQGVGTYSRFTKSLPPFNLKGETTGDFIKLDWEAINEPSIYGYYIYRGTSSKKLELVDGPIMEKTYTDSLEALSGRTHYFYAVAAQNLRQDTSQYSNVISIRPDKTIEIAFPTTVNIYYANGDIHLDWDDIRREDNMVEEYVLQRKVGEAGAYVTINKGALKKPTFVDEGVELGKKYFYRVASKSVYGDVSEFSLGTEYFLPKNKIATINKFFARRIADGVKISLPRMEYENRKSYNIYRRNAENKEYDLISTITATEFDYVDQNITEKEYYVYAITIVETDDREGPMGRGITVRVD